MPNEGVTAYPLTWPAGWPRTPAHQRREAAFRTGRTKYLDGGGSYRTTEAITLAPARDRLIRELDRLGAKYPVLSTNLELRLDGLPRSGQREPDDPGAAVYFQLRKRPIVLACDRWNKVAGNVAAIAAHIEAMRGMERWGVGSVERMFAGFQAIAAPGAETWRTILGIRPDEIATADLIAARRRELAARHHPDVPGGSAERMAQINAAADAALREIAS